jgi:hypothetical protein
MVPVNLIALYDFRCKDTHFPTIPHTFLKKIFVVLCSIMLTTPFRVRLILSRKAINKEDSANYSYQPYPLENFFASKQNGGAKSLGEKAKDVAIRVF